MRETRELKDDAEITLGTGKLLGIFFALTVICAVFFIMGYMLGRGSAAGAKTEIIGSVPSGNGPANKPSAGNSKATEASSQTCEAGSADCPPAVSGTDTKTPSAQSAGSTQPQATNPAGTNPSPPSGANAAGSESKNSSYIVQVAAVSKQEDAEFLVAALRRKQYPVFLASGGDDAYFRVQVGPFTDPKEAEAMRAKLAGEGYNPIVKK